MNVNCQYKCTDRLFTGSKLLFMKDYYTYQNKCTLTTHKIGLIGAFVLLIDL